MERQSNKHSRRLDDVMEHEVESLTHGAPIEARVEPGRAMEDAADGEPTPQAVIETVDPPLESGAISPTDVRRRSELATHLRPSMFPATRAAILTVAQQEDAPIELVAALEGLPAAQVFHTTEEVWEALGGTHEERTAATGAQPVPVQRFEFRFDLLHRVLAMPFGVTPASAHVDVDTSAGRLRARFGLWTVDTDLSNIAGSTITGGYFFVKTAGPAHVSLLDRGLTFATNDARGVCISFREPVRGIDPGGIIHHPALTVTVAEPERLVDVLRSGRA